MIFTSFPFFVFLPVVFIIYYLLPHRLRWFLILLCSSLFYGVFSWQYLLLFYFLIFFNWAIGIMLYSSSGHFRKRAYISGIFMNVLLLVFFKYYGHLNSNIFSVANFIHLHYSENFIRIIMPIGISFLVFTMISYLIDIKRRAILAEKHLGIFAAYSLFFPKLIQGPIERTGRVIPQFREKHYFSYEKVTGGLKLMAWGFFKKLVIADTLALLVDPVFAGHEKICGPVIILCALIFPFQLYADFSGYTDIALGSARVLGFDLTNNFQRPFLASSIRDFWSRWHISFSTWLRDYLFLPLAYYFSKKMKRPAYLSIKTEKWIFLFSVLITFSVCGLWHGNGTNFLVWGLLFALFLSWSNWTLSLNKSIRKKLHISKQSPVFRAYKILVTFLLVTFSFIFFRAASFTDAIQIITGFFHGWSYTEITYCWSFLGLQGINPRIVSTIVISLSILLYTDILADKKDIFERISETPLYVRWGIYYLIILIIIVYSPAESRHFIYLQF